MSEEGVARYHRKVEQAKAREAESSTDYGKRLLSASIIPFADSIRAWLKEHGKAKAGAKMAALKPLSKLTPEVSAFIATRVILDGIGLQKSYTSLCIALGAAIEDETRYAWLRKHHLGLFKKLEQQLASCHSSAHKRAVIVHAMNKAGISTRCKKGEDDIFVPETRPTHLKVGAVLFDLFSNATGLTELVNVPDGKRLRPVVQATAKATEWIRGFHAYAEVLDPVWLPMVGVPTPWQAPKGGGYNSEHLPLLDLVKRAGRDYIKDTLPKAVMPEVYEALNALQATGWCINRKVHGVMQHYWEMGRSVGGLPQSDDEELPTKPLDIATNEETRKEWKRRAAVVHVNNAVLRSLRLQARKLLNLAQKFANVERFYFPYQLDFRGRIYTVPTFLTPQGSDLARGLLTFADSVPLNSDDDAYWLAVYGANLFGKDKITFEERIAWVKSERENILRVAADPLGQQWWQTADEPWQFLAWCFEWAGWLQQGPGFLTSLPVCLDGTNNGLQILSLLTRDELAAKATNVLPGAKPEDIYGEVARRVVALMQEETKDSDTFEHSQYWLSFGIDRKTTKRPVMVLPYGGTFHSCRDYVQEWYRDTAKARRLDMPDRRTTGSRCHHLSKLIWEGIDFCVGRPREAMAWLQSCALAFVDANLPIRWTAPSGFPVLQDYKEEKSVTVQTTLGDKVRCIDLRQELPDKLSRSRQKNGISPNYVHSLDAAALVKTVTLCKQMGLSSFAMIHDSYGSHAPQVHVMAAALRQAFVSIFSEDQLSKLRNELQEQLTTAGAKTKEGDPVVLPPVPAFGSLDVSQLRHSEFFFA